MKVSLATEMAPPFVLVAHFFIAGIIFLSLSGIALLSMSSDISGYRFLLSFLIIRKWLFYYNFMIIFKRTSLKIYCNNNEIILIDIMKICEKSRIIIFLSN